MKYDVKSATVANLNHLLNSIDPGWQVIAIVPYGTTGNEFLVIIKFC